jgi:hypothetical protein
VTARKRVVHFRDAFYAVNSRELAYDYAGVTDIATIDDIFSGSCNMFNVHSRP